MPGRCKLQTSFLFVVVVFIARSSWLTLQPSRNSTSRLPGRSSGGGFLGRFRVGGSGFAVHVVSFFHIAFNACTTLLFFAYSCLKAGWKNINLKQADCLFHHHLNSPWNIPVRLESPAEFEILLCPPRGEVDLWAHRSGHSPSEGQSCVHVAWSLPLSRRQRCNQSVRRNLAP